MNICDTLAFDFFTACGLNPPAQTSDLIANGLNADDQRPDIIES